MSGYPGNWSTIRKKVLRRDSYTCGNCGRNGRQNHRVKLHVHHIVPKSKGGTDSIENLRTLCSACHKSIHGNSDAPTSDDSINNHKISDRESKRRGFDIETILNKLSNNPKNALNQLQGYRSTGKLNEAQFRYLKVSYGIAAMELGHHEDSVQIYNDMIYLEKNSIINKRQFNIFEERLKKTVDA